MKWLHPKPQGPSASVEKIEKLLSGFNEALKHFDWLKFWILHLSAIRH